MSGNGRRSRRSSVEGTVLEAANVLGHDAADIQDPEALPDPIEENNYAKKLAKKSVQEIELELKQLQWSPARLKLESIAMSAWFEVFMGTIIGFNAFLMMLQTDLDARCQDPEAENCGAKWMLIVDEVLLVIYTMELL
mmetsp:Transcript_23824/g.43205  ORF Transcript_23824/g.43205 Transcript_23824/m.43205 type:complete len:138 (-) Transcript_23824:10-423(-)